MEDKLLSQENINKLCMTGIYHCEPIASWRGSLYSDDLYWCCNWNFKVRKNSDDSYSMVDTYWSGADGLVVPLNDDNFDKFQLLFDLNEVKKVYPTDFWDYNEEDRWHIALDSGGMRFSKNYFVRRNAQKNKDKLLERLQSELESLKNQVKYKEEEIKKLLGE